MATKCLVGNLTARCALFQVGCFVRSVRTFRAAPRWFPWKRYASFTIYSSLGKLLPPAVKLC